MNTLAIDRLGVALGKTLVIAQASFTAGSGELLGLIGANGVGKSTLLRAVAGLIPHQSGSASWGGYSIAGMSAAARAKTMAYLPQGQTFHWGVSVRHVVALGRLPHLGPLSRMTDADNDAVTQAMTRAEVLDLADRSVIELSGGERSRVLFARALAVGAPVLLADEPTAALDPYHQLHTIELLRGLAAEGKVVIAVLHDLSLAARFCDRTLLLHDGRIVADGPPREVLTPAYLKAAYGIEAYKAAFDDQSIILPWKRLA